MISNLTKLGGNRTAGAFWEHFFSITPHDSPPKQVLQKLYSRLAAAMGGQIE